VSPGVKRGPSTEPEAEGAAAVDTIKIVAIAKNPIVRTTIDFDARD